MNGSQPARGDSVTAFGHMWPVGSTEVRWSHTHSETPQPTYQLAMVVPTSLTSENTLVSLNALPSRFLAFLGYKSLTNALNQCRQYMTPTYDANSFIIN